MTKKAENLGLCIALQNTELCINCDHVYDNRLFATCPNCGSSTTSTITLWIKPIPKINDRVVSINTRPLEAA